MSKNKKVTGYNATIKVYIAGILFSTLGAFEANIVCVNHLEKISLFYSR